MKISIKILFSRFNIFLDDAVISDDQVRFIKNKSHHQQLVNGQSTKKTSNNFKHNVHLLNIQKLTKSYLTSQ